ncbi:Uncharacterised protein [Mycobacteroides abscessus subsp. abscessus]|nr:Uncharacterised protein [Mycobacteroides abscessus subsp. abscessus]
MISPVSGAYQRRKGGGLHALAAVNLDSREPISQTRSRIEEAARLHGHDLTGVVEFRPSVESGWIFHLIEMVHRHSAHAVIVSHISDVDGAVKAVTGVADLISLNEFHAYRPYGPRYVRPSATKLASA